ncbi:dimethylglycine dehydrogenase, mitochondrial-like [Uloborus diversus]|uniref:dimethylglycine dehydrogenase, mitochondrial-like n=1 Tax=Uloborus diversus TaxID=327109 RepID=UPI002409F48D|nr:dimethylglycine dehydrogenase, mitochondrial-like [Uloborus diversus]
MLALLLRSQKHLTSQWKLLRLCSSPLVSLKSRKLSTETAQDNAEVVIIGGGAVGTSIAYHLSKYGMKGVTLLEKSELTAGSTWHAAGLTALYHPGINMKKIHYYSINLFSQLEQETGQPLSFHTPGSIRLATTIRRMDEFKYQMQRQGWNPAPQKLITPDEIFEHFPLLNMDGILGGLYNPSDGHIDPYSLTMAYAAGARKHGANILINNPVINLKHRSDGKWEVTTPNGTILAQRVINASGFWAHEIGRLLGKELPLVPIQHQYMITKPIKEVQNLKTEPPVLRHLEGSFYLRAERGGLLVGPYEYTHKMKVIEEWSTQGVPKGFGKELFQPDLDRLTDHLEVAMNLIPLIREADVQTVVNGPIMYTPDLMPMLGPCNDLPNMWLALGFGYGIIHSGGAGKYIAEWILNGEPPFDLVETDPDRFGKWTTSDYVFKKSRETYGMNNSYTFPKEERWAGRPTSRVPSAYGLMLKRGAEMNFHAGWEQPAWFALEGDDKGYKPSFHRTNWFQPVGRECALVMNKVGIIDLTPFAKIDVKGKDATSFLDRMLANKIPKVGKTNISHLLTNSGKVYAELTVTRLSDDHFFLITGSGSEVHDLRWLKDHARTWNARVDFENITDEMACLSVAGPLARDVLSKLTQEDLSNKAFPFLSAKCISIAGIPVRAMRISYTGELGWELYHSAKHNLTMYQALLDAGKDMGIGDFGTYAMNALRIEKGFRMWGAEMNMDSNPIEAGLDYFICMDKSADFNGKEALHNILRKGTNRKLAFLKVDTEDVDPEGNESVWCSGRVVGFTTSGSFGYTVGHAVAFAYVPPFLSTPGTQLEVELLGQFRKAKVLTGPPIEIESVRQRKKSKSHTM